MAGRQREPERAARQFSPNLDYILAVGLSWLVPGSGHWIMGRPVRGLILGAVLLGSFWWGEWISKGYAVTRTEHPIFFYGQIGNGLSAMLANGWESGDLRPRVPPHQRRAIDREIPPQLTTGILLTCVSGLLNMLLVLHIMDPRSWEAARARKAAEAAAGGGTP